MPDNAESPADELENNAVFQDDETVEDPDLEANTDTNNGSDNSMEIDPDNDTDGDVDMDDVDEVNDGVERMVI